MSSPSLFQPLAACCRRLVSRFGGLLISVLLLSQLQPRAAGSSIPAAVYSRQLQTAAAILLPPFLPMAAMQETFALSQAEKMRSLLSSTCTKPTGTATTSAGRRPFSIASARAKSAVGAAEVSLYADQEVTVALAVVSASPIIIKAVQYTPGKQAYIQPLSDTWLELRDG